LIRGKDDSGQCRLNRRTLDVYRFLRRELGSTYLQFIPIVEIKGFETTAPQTWDPARLPIVGSPQARPDHPDSVVTPWSVDPEEYGYFLSKVWDEWLARDVGKVLVNFCETLVVQHMGMPAQVKFAYAKSEQLPGYCRRCEFLKDCWGECPKNRLLRTAEGEPGRSTISARDSSGSSPTQCPRRRRWRPNCARRRRHHSGECEPRSRQHPPSPQLPSGCMRRDR
jgi:radical SAM protein with 4Fe4S-binding SPASM domain